MSGTFLSALPILTPNIFTWADVLKYCKCGAFVFQSGCEEDNECQNGGTMVWDPVKPFKCECPENYVREFCQQKICE
jgi:hypothetical protein